MPEENKNNELSLDDIFSRIVKENGGRSKVNIVPFKFLDSYTREDRNIFFGRDGEIEEVFRKLYSGKLLLVYGKSGTGKSSIVNCGLISRIPQEDIYPISIRCGKKAYDNFVSEIKRFSNLKLDNPLEILEDIFYEHSKPVTLIFDQFEEIFILSDEEEREKFGRELNNILKSRLKINVILIIREEYFANLTEFEAFIPGLYGNRVRIERMNKSAAKDAIIKPCLTCNVKIEDGLADKIIEQLIWQSEGLELTWLQILMDKLYRTAVARDPENPIIKSTDLADLGRIGNVLSDFLDEQLRLMPHGDQGEAVLKTMISTDGTKKQVNLDDISDTLHSTGHPLDRQSVEEILIHFVNVRIISDKNEQGYFELRHDALASRIYERMTAIEKEMVEVKTFLDNSFKIYEQRKALLTENDLKYIALYENKLILNDELKEFVKTSRKEVLKARLRRRNIAVISAIALIIVLSFFTIWAFNERAKALEQTRIAEEQKNDAINANKEAESARMLALERENKANENEAIAIKQRETAEIQRRAALAANREAENSRKQALEEKNRAIDNEKIALAAMKDAENAKNEVIMISNQARFYLYLFNGKELANKSLLMQGNDTLRALLSLSAFDLVNYGYKNFHTDYTSVIYDGEILKSLQNSNFLFETDSLAAGEVWAIVSKTGKLIFSNSAGQLIISGLRSENNKMLPSLVNERVIDLPVRSMVRSLCYDKISGRLACGTINGDVILFGNIDSDPSRLNIIYNHNNNRVLCMSFFPSKNWLISSSTDKTLRIWDMNQQKIVKELQFEKPVQKFVITDSDHLIFTNTVGNILKWDLNNSATEPEIIYSSPNHQPFQTLAYDTFHKWLVTASSGNILVFSMTDSKAGAFMAEQFTQKHKTSISQIDFSTDKKWLVTASADAIMLWDIRDESPEIEKLMPIIIENNRQIFSLAFDVGNKYIFYGDNRLLHICPIDIAYIYSLLKSKMENKVLSDQEWKYYIKGDLIKPEVK